jgi:hypothetical protein
LSATKSERQFSILIGSQLGHRRALKCEMRTVLNQSRLQHAAHLDALRKFARRKKISEDLAVAVYESERHRLTEGAKVERFVDILAEKRAKRALREMQR